MAARVRVLNVAEKPSVAKEITALLAKGRSNMAFMMILTIFLDLLNMKTSSFSNSNPIWTFDYRVEGEDCEMVFTSVLGHLQTFALPDELESNWTVDPIVLFDCPLTKKTAEAGLPIEKTLKAEAKKAAWLILWLDCDREGENIAFEVLNVCKSANRNLRIKRARFSALIARDLEHSLKTLVAPNQAEAEAVDVRMEIDKRIGFAFTRFQTSRWKYKFDLNDDKEPISYGPCQFPTLGFVVDQYWKHTHFTPEPFWFLNLQVQKEGIKVSLKWERVRLFDKLVCLIIYQNLLEDTRTQVVKVDKHPTRKYRPFPLTTVELQKTMSRKLHISAEKTMQIAEHLYQAGYISYPRTETNKFPANFDFHTLIQQQTQSPVWGAYADGLLNQGKFVTPKAGQFDDASHPPIHPIKFADGLQGHQAQIYEFVVRHYLACCSQDALGNETLVDLAMGPELFKTRGLAIQALNFLEIYPYMKWTNENIPNFDLGEYVTPTSLTMDEGTTTAPPLLTEADLIQLMNQNGIGTDATIAEHIATIVARKYVTKQGSRMELKPTKLGEALVAGYNFIGYRRLNQPQLRASLEADLKRICNGAMKKDAVLRQTIQDYKAIFTEVRQKVASLDKALAQYFPPAGTLVIKETRNFSTCGKCNSKMSLRLGQGDVNSIHCASCNQTLLLPLGTISNRIPQVISTQVSPNFHCPICNFQVLAVKSSKGKDYAICPFCYSNPPAHVKPYLKINTTGEVSSMPCFHCTHAGCPLKGGTISYEQSPVRDCPNCHSAMIVRQGKNGGYMISCSSFPACSKAMWFPSDIIKEMKPTSTPCPTCTRKPSYLVEFIYTDRAAFDAEKASDVSCVMGCSGCSIRLLLNRIVGDITQWELTKPHPVAPKPVAKPTSNTKPNSRSGYGQNGAKSGGSNFTRSGAGGAVTDKKTYASSSSSYASAKKTSSAKRASASKAKASSSSTAFNTRQPAPVSASTGNTNARSMSTPSTNSFGMPRAQR